MGKKGSVMDDADERPEVEAVAETSPLGVARLAVLFGLLTGALELTQ